MALPVDRTEDELIADAEERIMAYLRARPGEILKQWNVLNVICKSADWRDNRLERQFFLIQLNRLIKEKKIIRYRTRMNRGGIRISEAYV